MTKLGRIWGDGKQAFHDAWAEDKNPYPGLSREWHEWRCGWMCGAYELAWRYM